MRLNMKKLLSLLLVVGILASMFIFPSTVSAEGGALSVTLNSNGGKFVGEADTDLTAGEALPTAKQISRSGCIFAGWYDNADFTGNALTAVPADATGAKTYYAKWVVQNTVFDNFDGDTQKTWDDWDPDYELLTYNKDAENVYSGTTSIRGEVVRSWNTAYLYLVTNFQVVGDGIALWVKSDTDIAIDFQFNYQNVKIEKVNVPAGEGFVFLPWSAFTGDLSGGTWNTLINVYAPAGTVYYIDEIGTYKEMTGNISFVTDGGTFVNDALSTYYGGMALPTAKDITRNGCIFAGWYDNADFTGNALTAVPADATGAKTYYAKWVVSGSIFDNFDGDTQRAWGDWNHSGLALNTDASNAYSGSNSEKVTITQSGAAGYLYVAATFPTDGDGISFWVKTETAVQVQVGANHSTVKSAKFDVPAGEGFVFIPWTALPGVVESGIWTIQFTFYGATNEFVYVDNIGTYSEIERGITFETGDGEFVTAAPSKYTPGMVLPNYENVINGNLIFAGWYDNADLTGSAIYVVPADASGDKTYYAKWVKTHTAYYDFEANQIDSKYADWATSTGLTHNTDVQNSYSGNSIKYNIGAGVNGYFNIFDGTMVDGEGVYFWIRAEKATTLYIRLNDDVSKVSSDITVPAGKTLVAVPWSSISNAPAKDSWAGSLQIMTRASSEENNIYIDNIATYYDLGKITFNLNGGESVITLPTDYYPNMVLPTYKDVEKEHLIFAGWYDNADLTGSAIYVVPADASGDKTYYARWINKVSMFDNFDADSKAWKDNAIEGDNDISPNTDAANAYSGENALKYTITTSFGGGYIFTADSLHVEGDGVYFWIKTAKAVNVRIQTNYSGSKSNIVSVPAGESFVVIPWSAFDGTLTSDLWAFEIQVTGAANGDVIYVDDIGTFDYAPVHAFDDGHCAICGAIVYDYDNNGVHDIRDLVLLKNQLTESSDDFDASNDNNGVAEEKDLAELRKYILGLK